MADILPSKATLPSSYPIKRLTYSEMQQLRDQGLCLNCNDIDTPSHRCPVKRILLMLPDEDPDFEQQSREIHAPTVPEKLNCQDISVHAVNHASDLKAMHITESVDKLEKNSGVAFFQVLDARPAHEPAWLNEQKWADAHNMFVEMIKPFELSFQLANIVNNNAYLHLAKFLSNPNTTSVYSQILSERKPLIFDPGGKIQLPSLLVARFKHGDAQLNHNPISTTPMPLSPTFDLEDKVDLEGVGDDMPTTNATTHDNNALSNARPKRVVKIPRKFME